MLTSTGTDLSRRDVDGRVRVLLTIDPQQEVDSLSSVKIETDEGHYDAFGNFVISPERHGSCQIHDLAEHLGLTLHGDGPHEPHGAA